MGSYGVRRSVVFLMVLVAVANSLVTISPPAMDNCTVERLESRLNNIESQLIRIGEALSTCNKPPIKTNCTVELASYGYEDTIKLGYVRTNEGSRADIFVPEDPTRNRGVTLFKLDFLDCTLASRMHFDTWASASDRRSLLTALDAAPLGTVIVAVTADSAEDQHYLQDVVGPFLRNYNIDLSGLEMRDKFAFVLQKGFPSKTVFERKPHDEGSLEMKVEIEGRNVDHVTLTQVRN